MTAALLDLPVHVRRRLARALATGFVGPPFTPAALRSVVALSAASPDVVSVLRNWERLGVPPPAMAAWLDSLGEVESRRDAPQFVWSGPRASGVRSRSTRDALEGALASAGRSVWLSTYAYFDGKRAFEVLANRMDGVPALEVVLLLNIERKRGDTTREGDLVRRFARRFWTKDWPGARRPRVYYDPRSLDPSGAEGVLHAKALVVDEEQVLVTSANLTERALGRNIEVGVLLRDRVFAQTAILHFRGLIERKLIAPLPSAS